MIIKKIWSKIGSFDFALIVQNGFIRHNSTIALFLNTTRLNKILGIYIECTLMCINLVSTKFEQIQNLAILQV